MKIKEDKIRDYIVKRIKNNNFKINNLSEYIIKLENYQQEFLQIEPDSGGPNSKDLVKQVLINKLLRNIKHLEDIELLGKEFQLKKDNKRGRKPALDILAITNESKNLILIEVKKSSQTERESVTELSAYSGLLNKKIYGLSKNNTIWMPISTDWKTTTKEAFIHQVFSSNEICIPLHIEVESEDGKNIDKINLSLIDMIEEIDNMKEEIFHSLFSLSSYDAFTINFKEEVEDIDEIMHLISSWCSELNVSGFIYNTESNVGDYFMFPWGMVVVLFNPYKAYLKQKQLALIKEEDGYIEMLKNVKKDIWTDFDVNLKDEKIYFPIPNTELENDKPEISIKDLAINLNQSHLIMEKFNEYFKIFLKTGDFEIRILNFYQLFNNKDYLFLNALGKFSYFGIFEKVFLERIKYDLSIRDRNGDNPILGDLFGSPFSLYSNWSYFLNFIELINFEHTSQSLLEEFDEN